MSRRDELLEPLSAAVAKLAGTGAVTYTGLSIGALSAEAGISRPTFYAYFTDKNDLLKALVELAAADLNAAVDPRNVLATRATLDEAVHGIFAAYGPHRVVLDAVAEVASYDPEIRTWYHGGVELVAHRFAREIGRARPRRVRDHTQTARWLVWTTERGLRRVHAGHRRPAPSTVQSLTDLLWLSLQ